MRRFNIRIAEQSNRLLLKKKICSRPKQLTAAYQEDISVEPEQEAFLRHPSSHLSSHLSILLNQLKLLKRAMRWWSKHQKHVLPNGPTSKQHGYQQLHILLHAHMVYNREVPKKLKHKTFWLVLGDCLNYSSQINLTKWFQVGHGPN